MTTSASASTAAAATVTPASVLVALASSLAAYFLGAVALPFLAAFLKRDRALRRLGLPTPEPRSLVERALGTFLQYDARSPENYCRTIFMDSWMRELGGSPPLIVTRVLDKHFVLVLDPGAATSVR